MPTARLGFNGAQFHYELTTVTLNGSGTGSVAVVFDTAYQNAPVVLVIPPLGAAGTWVAGSITTAGFTLTVTSATDLASETVQVGYMAHQKL